MEDLAVMVGKSMFALLLIVVIVLPYVFPNTPNKERNK